MDFGTAMAAGWSSGISVYGVTALVGISGRLGWIDAPDFVEQAWVIAVALALFAVEFVIDKIALVDSTWDAVHTVIRPAIGAYLMSSVADTDVSSVALAGVGAVLALTSHSAKAATRLVVNTSPEPFSNVGVSLAEDGLVLAVMTLAIARPEIAVAVTVVLAIISILVAVVLYRSARRVVHTLRRTPSGDGRPEVEPQ
jgi:ABC-type iron transport system FetAB permease component